MSYGSTPAQKKTVEALNWSGFKASSDRQLVPIRQLELAKTKARLEADTAMSAEERKAKVDDVNAKLKALADQLAQK